MCLRGLAVQSLHANREQCDREEALRDFKESVYCQMWLKYMCQLYKEFVSPEHEHLVFYLSIQVVFGSSLPQT